MNFLRNFMTLLLLIFLVILYLSCVYVSNHFEYKKGYWFFEFSHLAAGFTIAAFLSNFLMATAQIIIGAAFVGLIWEAGEIIIDKSEQIKNFLNKLNIRQGPITFLDTILDLGLDVTGALIFVLIF